MANISFALTTQEFLDGRKTATRRFWKDIHLDRWQRWYDDGKRLHTAVDKVTFAGGKKIGQFVLTARPFLQPLGHMTNRDLEEEGGMCSTLAEFCDLIGYPPDAEAAVVKFARVENEFDCPDCDGGRWLRCIDHTRGDEPVYLLFHVDAEDGRVTGGGWKCIPF